MRHGAGPKLAFLVAGKKCQDTREGWNIPLDICPAARTRVFQGTTDHRNKEKSCRHRKTYQTTIVSDFSAGSEVRAWPLPHTNTYTRVLKKKFRECSFENTPRGTQLFVISFPVNGSTIIQTSIPFRGIGSRGGVFRPNFSLLFPIRYNEIRWKKKLYYYCLDVLLSVIIHSGN